MTRLRALVAGLILLAVGGVAVWAYRQRVEAERLEQRARDEALADADRAWDERRLIRLRADRQAELAALPGRVVNAFAADPLPPAVAEKRAAEMGKQVVGVWVGGGRTIEYHPNGTFRDAATGGRECAGTWAVARLTGTRVLHLTRTGGGPGLVKMTIEGNELIHDDEPGTVSVLRRP